MTEKSSPVNVAGTNIRKRSPGVTSAQTLLIAIIAKISPFHCMRLASCVRRVETAFRKFEIACPGVAKQPLVNTHLAASPKSAQPRQDKGFYSRATKKEGKPVQASSLLKGAQESPGMENSRNTRILLSLL